MPRIRKTHELQVKLWEIRFRTAKSFGDEARINELKRERRKMDDRQRLVLKLPNLSLVRAIMENPKMYADQILWGEKKGSVSDS